MWFVGPDPFITPTDSLQGFFTFPLSCPFQPSWFESYNNYFILGLCSASPLAVSMTSRASIEPPPTPFSPLSTDFKLLSPPPAPRTLAKADEGAQSAANVHFDVRQHELPHQRALLQGQGDFRGTLPFPSPDFHLPSFSRMAPFPRLQFRCPLEPLCCLSCPGPFTPSHSPLFPYVCIIS